MIISRRKFLTLGSASLALLGGGVATAYATGYRGDTTGELEITEHTIFRQNLPDAFDNFTIAFISDLHYSPAIPREWISRLIEIINSRSVDLILLGGDYIWFPDSELASMAMAKRNNELSKLKDRELILTTYQHLKEEFSKLKSTHGVFGIFGNHDRWTDSTLCKETFDESGARLLINEREILTGANGESIELFGADDYWTGMPKVPEFTSSPDSLKILLSHNPDHVVEQCAASLPNDTLCFSGHTHGGQILLPFYGPLIYNIRSTGYGYGINPIGKSTLITSRGVGVVELPYRINCPQELVFIQLQTKK